MRERLRLLEQERVNTRYLPGAAFPESLTIVHSLADALKDALYVLVAVPSSFVPSGAE